MIIKKDFSYEMLTYIEARKRLYKQEYIRLIRKLPEYQKILNMVLNGLNICIHDIDVPSPEKKGYYGSLCRPDGIFVCNKRDLDLLINDSSEAFGHGLCIAMALIEDVERIIGKSIY